MGLGLMVGDLAAVREEDPDDLPEFTDRFEVPRNCLIRAGHRSFAEPVELARVRQYDSLLLASGDLSVFPGVSAV